MLDLQGLVEPGGVAVAVQGDMPGVSGLGAMQIDLRTLRYLEATHFKPEDMLFLTGLRGDRASVTALGSDTMYLEELAKHPAWSLWDCCTLIACCGFEQHPCMPWVAAGWMVISPALDRDMTMVRRFHRTMRRGIEATIEHYRLRRLQATVEAADNRARKWAERLGFAFEGIMKGYGAGGEDHALFARLGGF